MTIMVGWQFQCANTTCLPFVTGTISSVRMCQITCLDQDQCHAATFDQSISSCKLFTNIQNQIGNLVADMNTNTMIIIYGTRIPPELTTTSTSTSTSTTTTTINPCMLGTYRWNTTGITVLNSSQITKPSGIFFDSNDTLYIVDEDSNCVVWKLPKNTTNPILIAGQILSIGSNSSQLNAPQGVSVDSKQNLYVSDYFNYRIQKYVNGSRIGVTIAGISASSGAALNQFNGPRHLLVDPSDTYIYIADSSDSRIMRYLTNSTTGTNGTVVAGGTGSGNTDTQLNGPWGIDYLPSVSNYLYIANNLGHSVMRWTPGNTSGVFIGGTPGVSGSNATLLNYPMGIKIDVYLNMFVADCGNHRIQLFCYNNQTGTTIAGTGTAGSDATQFNGPRGIAFDSSMNMYVSDFENQRIQKFLKL